MLFRSNHNSEVQERTVLKGAWKLGDTFYYRDLFFRSTVSRCILFFFFLRSEVPKATGAWLYPQLLFSLL